MDYFEKLTRLTDTIERDDKGFPVLLSRNQDPVATKRFGCWGTHVEMWLLRKRKPRLVWPSGKEIPFDSKEDAAKQLYMIAQGTVKE